jgi:beta-mannosidase
VARLAARIELTGHAAEAPDRVELRVGDDHTSARTDATVLAIGRYVDLAVTIPEPRLWWTWDLGEPHTYDCSVSFYRDGELLDRRELRTGLREVRFDPGDF